MLCWELRPTQAQLSFIPSFIPPSNFLLKYVLFLCSPPPLPLLACSLSHSALIVVGVQRACCLAEDTQCLFFLFLFLFLLFPSSSGVFYLFTPLLRLPSFPSRFSICVLSILTHYTLSSPSLSSTNPSLLHTLSPMCLPLLPPPFLPPL